MHRKFSLVSFLVILLLLSSAVTFAYWVSSVNVNNVGNTDGVDTGIGEEVTVSVTVGGGNSGGQVLVPAGFVVDALTQTDAVVFSYEVTWTFDERLEGTAPANLSATVSNILVNGVANPFNLAVVTPDPLNPTMIELGSTVTMVFVVTLLEPANVTEYNAVAGLPITFDITFTVAPA